MFVVEHIDVHQLFRVCYESRRDSPTRVVVVGASAGGIPALIALLSELPADFPYGILLVLHLSAEAPSALAEVLSRHTSLRVKWAEDGECVAPGTVHVAPPKRHLLLKDGDLIELSAAPPIGWWRPAVDALFTSAAKSCGSRVVAIVLSGAMWDGAAGIEAVWKGGGLTLVQDEITSQYFDMPAAALDLGHADVMLSPRKMAQFLIAATDAV